MRSFLKKFKADDKQDHLKKTTSEGLSIEPQSPASFASIASPSGIRTPRTTGSIHSHLGSFSQASFGNIVSTPGIASPTGSFVNSFGSNTYPSRVSPKSGTSNNSSPFRSESDSSVPSIDSPSQVVDEKNEKKGSMTPTHCPSGKR